MKTKLTLSMIFATIWLFSTAQWQQLHPRPLAFAASGLSAPGANKVFATTGSSILVSENLGASWQHVFIPDQYTYFTQLSFANPLQGAATSYEGRVYVTSDGGYSWQKKQLTSSSDFNAVQMLPTGVGFAGGDYGRVYKTTDFGINWTRIQYNFDQDDIVGIFILDNDNVFVFDDWDAFYWSNDGGGTWNESQFSNINTPHSMHFFDAQNGLLGDDYGKLFKTNNGGQSWQFVINDGTTPFYSMSFFNSQKGIIGCWDKMMITDDGGQNWQDIEMPGYGDFRNIDWKSENIIFASCDEGQILRSMDGGLSWETISQRLVVSSHISTAAYFDDSTILAFTGFSNQIMRSTNKGFSWSLLPPPAEGFHQHKGSHSINGQALFVITNAGKVFKTTNGGDSWQEFETGISVLANSIYFITPQIGFFTAMDGKIHRTTDGGQNWTAVWSGTQNIIKMTFYDNQLGLAVGTGGVILRTTDGGQNWTSIANENTNQYNDVYFVNDQTVFAVGILGRIYRSQNAGLNWTRITMSTSASLYSIVFITPDEGYVTTSTWGINLKTTNGGLDWSNDACLGYRNSMAIKTPNGSILLYGEFGHISILPKEGTWNKPAAPLATPASAVNDQSFTANWQTSQSAREYLLFVSEDNFTTYLPGYVGKRTEQTTLAIEGLQGGKTYYYRVMAANEAGYSEYSNTITVQSNPTNIASFQESMVMVYPNPAKTHFYIETETLNSANSNMEIINMAGQVIFKTITDANLTRIDIQNWHNGVYIIRIQTPNRPTITRKISIIR